MNCSIINRLSAGVVTVIQMVTLRCVRPPIICPAGVAVDAIFFTLWSSGGVTINGSSWSLGAWILIHATQPFDSTMEKECIKMNESYSSFGFFTQFIPSYPTKSRTYVSFEVKYSPEFISWICCQKYWMHFYLCNTCLQHLLSLIQIGKGHSHRKCWRIRIQSSTFCFFPDVFPIRTFSWNMCVLYQIWKH